MTHALIIGGGIAGPLAALGLRLAGYSVTLCEAYPESAGLAIGAWLTVAVNGIDAMRSLGIQGALFGLGFPSDAMEIMNGRGKRLGVVPIGGKLADGTMTQTLKRADLYRCVLGEAERRGIRVLYGKKLVDLSQDGTSVTARFEDGSEARADFLIGADGVRSRVRRCLDPKAPGPRYNGLGNVGGFCPSGSVDLAPGVYRLVFGTRGFFGYTVAPGGEVWWFANPPRREEARPDELAHLSSNAGRSLLIDTFRDDIGPMARLVEETPGPLVWTNQYDLARVPHWHKGRVLLIGDAAHAAAPSSGQGASQAAEDAVTLAKLLDGAKDIPQAMDAFVRERKPRAERVVAYGARYSSMKVAGPVGRFFRDLMMPIGLRMQAKFSGPNGLGWLFLHHIDWSPKNTLQTPAEARP
jgi:2-polyprenyl-6-methoxyphenol hydroxylase-like FAD-dependent oxidoreductase